MTLANKITVGRIFLVPVFIAVMVYYSPQREHMRWIALSLYLAAQAADVLDGIVARYFHQKTRAGAILDPLADKFLFISALICLYRAGIDHSWTLRMPLWLVVAFLSRDIILITGGVLLGLKSGLPQIQSNAWGKCTAFLQTICIVAVFLQWEPAVFVWGIALLATIVSGTIYIKEGIRVLNDERY